MNFVLAVSGAGAPHQSVFSSSIRPSAPKAGQRPGSGALSNQQSERGADKSAKVEPQVRILSVRRLADKLVDRARADRQIQLDLMPLSSEFSRQPFDIRASVNRKIGAFYSPVVRE